MKWIGKIVLLCIFLNSCQSVNKKNFTKANYSIIPKPQFLSKSNGVFELNENTILSYDSTQEKNVLFFTNFIKNKYGILLQNNGPKSHKKNEISFEKLHTKLNHKQTHNITIESNTISISSTTESGTFYAVQSLIQLIELNNSPKSKTLYIPNGIIKDWASFKHRGMLLDCCRHFFSVSTIKKYLKLMSYYKLNILHWHLTEDQGWRIAIDSYPKLTEIGAYRKDSSGIYGGYYTKEEIKEIVSFAKELHIDIIPEIELPGHSQAAIAAYPYLSCTNEKFEVANDWGVFKEIYCAGNDSVFIFLENVLDEVVKLFPYKYIHIGGDEAPKYRWENCEKCQQIIKKNQLKDEHELQSYFIQRINNYLKSKNKSIIGWDEILEGGIAHNATVQSWRGMNGGEQAVKNGNQAIMSPTSHAYFDYDIKTTDLKKVYAFNPIPDSLNEKEKKLIIGGECNVWTEHIPDENELDNKVFPRLLAMAEVLWTNDKNRQYNEFKSRINSHYPILSNKKVKYGIEVVPCKIEVNNDNAKINLIKADQDLTLKYKWLNTNNSYTYYNDSSLIDVKSDKLIVQAFKNNTNYGKPISQLFKNHLGLSANVSYLTSYHSNYKGNKELNLVDGKLGSKDFRDGCWQGFWEKDLKCTIDLKKIKPIKKIGARFYQYNNSWIFFPKEIHIESSADSITWKKWGTVNNKKSNRLRGKNIQSYELTKPKTIARYIKIHAKNLTTVPFWHEAAGSGAWLFCDEVIIE